jgi:large subunit ribosomal protein L4
VATLKKFNLEGQETGHAQIDDRIANAEANGQMIKDYIIALRANARQWSANTQTRGEVNHSTKKPHPQKGGGRARQGMLSTPQYKGGGRVFGPRPKFDQHVRINKQERKAAIRFLIGEKIRDAPKTKVVSDFLKARNLSRRVLFLGERSYLDIDVADEVQRFEIGSDKHQSFQKSLRNIPFASFALASNISGYDVMVAHDIILTEAALKELNEWLC